MLQSRRRSRPLCNHPILNKSGPGGTIMGSITHLQRNVSRAHQPPTLRISTSFSAPHMASTQPLSPGQNYSSECHFMPNDAWISRPPLTKLYGQLAKLFPGHDLDKPIMNALQFEGLTPVTPLNTAVGKRSIRLVASERSSNLDLLGTPRTRAITLWGHQGEEITPVESVELLGCPRGVSDPRPIFKWLKGELIGKGTYGRVYLALNATMGEMLAVKQFEVSRADNEQKPSWWGETIAWLRSETLKDIDHPNVVQCLGFDQSEEFLSIFLEYVPGGSIGRCLRKYGKLDHNLVRKFASQILDGVAHIHSHGITHGDLKADNVLLDPSGTCKICDLGVPKHSDDIRFTTMQSSIFWMAPEVVQNNKRGYSTKVDIWSLGCLVLEMWSGQRPWYPDDIVTVLFKLGRSREGPPLPNDVQLDIVEEDFRQKCCAADPTDRPTAAELRNHRLVELDPNWTFTGFS